MIQKSEDIVLGFFKLLDFPGIRRGEDDKNLCKYLKTKGYNFTPDLIAGPPDIKDAAIGGLFFVDVIQPTTDLLFNSEFYSDSEIDVPSEFQRILYNNHQNNLSTYIDMLPNLHHDCYLEAMNKKLDKYAHQRKFDDDGEQLISANFGLVHHFNLGEFKEGKVSDVKKLITLLDYIRFYKRIAPSKNIDLKNAENLLLNELVNENQSNPYLLFVGRDLKDLPYLFNLLHISIIKKSISHHLALIFLNTSHLDNSDGTYPVHKWFIERIFNPESVTYSNDEYKEKKVIINIGSDTELFS